MRCLLAILCCLQAAQVIAEDVSFRRQLAPILVRRCLGCHDNRKTEGRYAVHTFQMLMKAGDTEETPIVAGDPEASFLFEKLVATDDDERMPQEDDPLAPEEIALFRRWIEQGAHFDGQNKSARLRSLLPTRAHPLPPPAYRRPIPTFAIRFSLDGKSLFTGGWHELLVWDVASGKLQQRVAGLPQRIHGIAISPDGKWLAVGGGAPGEYGEIRLVDVAQLTNANANKQTQNVAGADTPLPQHELLSAWDDMVLDLQFTTDGNSLVAVGADNSVRGYDLSTRKETWKNRQHVDWVTAVDVSGYRFSESRESNAGLPDFFTLNEQEIKSGSHIQQRWQFSPSHFIVRKANWELESRATSISTSKAGSPRPVRLTRITTSGIGKFYKVERVSVSDAPIADAPTPDANKEASLSGFAEHADVIAYLTQLESTWPAENAGEHFVLTASKDRTVKVFLQTSGKLFTTYKGHRREYGPLAGMHRVFGVQAERASRRVWSGGEGKHFHGWNPVTVRDEDGTAADMEARFAKEYSIDLLRHDFLEPTFSLTSSQSRLFAATASGEVSAFSWGPDAEFDVKQLAKSMTYGEHSDQLYTVDVSPHHPLVAAAGFRGEVVIWDAENGKLLNRFMASPQEPSTK